MGEIDRIGLATLSSLGKGVARNTDEKTALRAFDAYFLGEMLKRSAPKNPTGLFDGGQAGRMYQDHLYQELARMIAEDGRFGLSKALEGTLESQSEEPQKEAEVGEEAGEEQDS